MAWEEKMRRLMSSISAYASNDQAGAPVDCSSDGKGKDVLTGGPNAITGRNSDMIQRIMVSAVGAMVCAT